MALSISQKVVLGRENSYGIPPAASTDVSATFTNAALPIETANVNLVIEPFNDQTKKGNVGLDSNQYPTVRRVEGSIEGPFYNDECAFFLLALLGEDTNSTTSHVFSGKTDFSVAGGGANSLTIDVRDDVSTAQAVGRSYKGCYVSGFTLRFSAAEGITTYTANVVGQDASTSFSLGNPAFAEPIPTFGWTGAFNIGAESRTADLSGSVSQKDCVITDMELTMNRPTSLFYAFHQSQLACRADPGPLEVTVKLTADWDASASVTPQQWFQSYTSTGASPYDQSRLGMLFTLDNGITTAARRIMTIYLPSVSIIDGPLEVDRSNTTMTLAISGRALNNSLPAINGPVQITLSSRKTGAYDS